ncbi:MAG: hypothetical protein Q8K93_29120 [Reyranella sp.]|uniref:hypothetical protein n=1 Tax=Reyranella sp. TaxID=1929291 RepID=UPI002731CFAD|nr:hypothetical protein [Reyranella sp.]MDP1966251.1 hypothetical protein [Reyranella sp.]MDP2377551.1 hypothetical protein [Reyranella sp.]
MEADSKTHDLDVIVAALLAAPVIEPGASPPERIEKFAETLRHLRKMGGVARLRAGTD